MFAHKIVPSGADFVQAFLRVVEEVGQLAFAAAERLLDLFAVFDLGFKRLGFLLQQADRAKPFVDGIGGRVAFGRDHLRVARAHALEAIEVGFAIEFGDRIGKKSQCIPLGEFVP